jgi:NADH-quinone oxidoreductase subunit H
MLSQINYLLTPLVANNIVIFFCLIIPILLAVAYLTLIERKLLAVLQIRRGPNVVFIFGLLQPIADAIKLFTKESFLPRRADKYIYLIAPVLFLTLALTNWAFLTFTVVYLNMEYTTLYILMISSLSVYGILLAGWSSGSIYGFFGAIRSAGQLISYELTFSLIILIIFLKAKNLNLYFISEFQKYLSNLSFLLPLGIIFFISLLAELCRPPFDLPEAEAELVSGYNVDYSSLSFAFYFIGEYSNIILMSMFFVLLFLPVNLTFITGFLCIFIIKALLMNTLIIYIRGIVPRYRYDQLMKLQWMYILPFVLGYVVLIIFLILAPYKKLELSFSIPGIPGIPPMTLLDKILDLDYLLIRIMNSIPIILFLLLLWLPLTIKHTFDILYLYWIFLWDFRFEDIIKEMFSAFFYSIVLAHNLFIKYYGFVAIFVFEVTMSIITIHTGSITSTGVNPDRMIFYSKICCC